MSKPIIGVMGPGNNATEQDCDNAFKLGKLIAKESWILLTGGRNIGVMDAASKGAKKADGLVVGILPSENKMGMSRYVDIPICTGMGGARNNINVLSSDVVVALGLGAGTTSEIMLTLKADKPMILLSPKPSLVHLLEDLSYPMPAIVASPQQTIQAIKNQISY